MSVFASPGRGAMPTRRQVMAGLGAALGASLTETACAQPRSGAAAFRPESFGAVGDGRTNDGAAFARLSAALQAAGGGTVEFGAGKTYIVGRQTLTPRGAARAYSWTPDPIVRVHGARQAIVIAGNGARLKAAAGLRYGSFEPGTGAARPDRAPFLIQGKAASPYLGMIELTGCTGGITVRDLELDGSIDAMIIGGEYGDLDRQIPACGLYLIGNSGALRIDNVHAHHHCLDGVLLRQRSTPDQADGIRIARLNAHDNGRQGLSLTGGRGGMVSDSHFDRTGRAAISSAPRAGVDIEAEGGEIVRDWTFEDCEFVDNAGPGLLANRGDSAGLLFRRCRFIGTTSYSIWPDRPGIRFEDCQAVGAVVNIHGGGGDVGARFTRCRFTDDPALAPGGRVYVATGPIVNLAQNGGGARFVSCDFRCVGSASAIYSDNSGNMLADCTLSQRGTVPMVPWVTFDGTNVIRGRANTTYMRIRQGTVTVNGVVRRAGG